MSETFLAEPALSPQSAQVGGASTATNQSSPSGGTITAATTQAGSATGTTAPVKPSASSTSDPDQTADVRTIVGEATKLVAEYTFAPIGYGSAGAPPSEALNACAGVEQVALSAFAQGTVTFRYVTGTLPLQFEVPSTNAVLAGAGDGPLIGLATMEYEGQWHCAVPNGKQGFSLKPGATLTVPTWIIFSGVRTNAKPELSREELNGLTLDLTPEVGEAKKETVSGPQAFKCGNNELTLHPWATATPADCEPGGGIVSKTED